MYNIIKEVFTVPHSFTYPDFLPDASGKCHWYYNDCFGEEQFEYLHPFIHLDYEIGMHTHSFYEINIILSGEGRHYIENSSLPAQTGNVFIIPPNVKHGYYKYTKLDVYHILVADSFFDTYASELKKHNGYSILFEVEPYLRSRYNESMFLTLSDETLKTIMPYLDLLISYNDIEYSAKEIVKNANFLALTGHLCYLMCRQNNIRATVPHQRYAHLLMKSIEFIHNHYNDKISIQLLSEIACMSASSYIRYFKKMYACAPMEYVIQYRIKKAKALFTDDDMNLTDIAQNCGFYDASHFTRHFKKSELVSPITYRKNSS